MQHNIFLSSYRFNFRLVKRFQGIFIRSIFARLSSVNYALNVLNCQNKFSSYEKFRVALSLRYPFFSNSPYLFYIPKKKGYSLLFLSENFYNRSLQSLYNFSILPYLDMYSERRFYSNRPFRDCRDTFLEVKNFLSSNNLDYSVLRIRLSKVKRFGERSNFLNNNLDNNKVFNDYSEQFSEDFQNTLFDLSSSNFTIFDITLNGLLWIWYISIMIILISFLT